MSPIPCSLPRPTRAAATPAPLQPTPWIKIIKYNKKHTPRHPLAIRFPSLGGLRRGCAKKSVGNSLGNSVGVKMADPTSSAEEKFMRACATRAGAEAKFVEACRTERYKTASWAEEATVLVFED